MTKTKNRYEIYADFCIGYTTNTNKPFYFDTEHLSALKQYEWVECNKQGKVVAEISPRRAVSLANVIYPRQAGYVVSFKNRSPNDVRSSNILIESVRE